MTRNRRASVLAGVVLASIATCASASNLITNPGFEADGPSATVFVPTGWTADGAYNLHPSFNFVTNNPLFVYAGDRALSISNYEYEAVPHLSQTFTDMIGATYQVSFFATSLMGTAGSFLQAAVGGSSITLHGALPAYAPFSFSFVGTGSDTLSFGAVNSAGYYYIDGVTVDLAGAAVPEASIWSMLLLGFGGLGAVLRSRRAMVAA